VRDLLATLVPVLLALVGLATAYVRMRFRRPLAHVIPPPRPSHPAVPRVLIVDDERALAVALARLLRLEIEGLHVEVATSGEEALAMVRSRLVRVLIADVGLEGLSGVELVRRMRDEGLLAGAVVILISALGAEELEELSRQAGATRSFAKPVDGRALVEAVRAALV